MSDTPLLSIDQLAVAVSGRTIINDFSLTIQPGEVHAIMGPNGSGKSTLVSTLMGHPAYVPTAGTVRFLEKNLLELPVHERARLGLFLAFQYPKDIAGVTLRSFLFAAYNAQMAARCPSQKKISPIKFRKFLEEKMSILGMDPAFAERFVNQGFSGGEKKKAEILQLHVLQPRLALLDETDSGLDVDALRQVAEGVNALRSPSFSAVLVTHYARILEYIVPDRVHVMIAGRIVQSGGPEFARQLEQNGYEKYLQKPIGSITLDTAATPKRT